MTGMRWSELASLMWSDMDAAEGYIRIRESKTESGVRTVAIGPDTIEALRLHRLSQMKQRVAVGSAWSEGDVIFASPTGTEIGHSTFQSKWIRIRAQAGFPELHFHDLRHVHASLLVKAGVHPKVAQA